METISRQLDILTPSPLSIRIIGAGGIGSATAFMLAKMGYTNITVHDFDEVEIHNVNAQFYGPDDLHKAKVTALAENIKRMTGVSITPVNGLVEVYDPADIIIYAVDNIKVREDLFKKNPGKGSLLIDGRMGGQTFNIYAVMIGVDDQRYLDTIFPESEASPIACTAKAISYNVYGLASQIANIIKKYDRGEKFPFELNYCYVNDILLTHA